MKHLIKYNESRFTNDKIEKLDSLWIKFCNEFSDESGGFRSFTRAFNGVVNKKYGEELHSDAEAVLKSLQSKLDEFKKELSKI